MKFTKAQIAALVLGYLKSEKLLSVAGEFLKCCQYFEENNVKMGKYFATRVAGMTLVDFLEEYALIYSIVQSRLEETNYYEVNSKTSLVEQLLYLLDKGPASSTPVTSYTNEVNSASCKTNVSASSEVDTTPAHALPGNCILESDSSSPKTPKKKSSRIKSKENKSVIDMNEVITQSFLEHELHEKLAETINNVRNTPDVAKPVSEERLSADASNELDAVIKTVIQKTEEDPLYNKFLDEIIGTSEIPAPKKSAPHNTRSSTSSLNPEPETSEKSRTNSTVDPMDDHNNAAIRSIMEVAQSTDSTTASKNENGEVYLFDGTLDTYLKSSGAVNTNPVYLNPGLIVVPPPEPSKQFYIVNNQPVLKMTTVLTEKEIMSLPTVIVNDPPANKSKKSKRPKILKPKKNEKKSKLIDSISTMESDQVTVVTASQITPSVRQSPCTTTPSMRQASHVRNLDFSTPGSKNVTESVKLNGTESVKSETKTGSKTWDADLRQLVSGCKDKSPSPKRKRPKKKKSDEENENEEKEKEKEAPKTPVKEVPKTPGGAAVNISCHCTPFNDVIDEQLKGVDLNSIPTPSIPITPGFALTPGDLAPYSHRGTDYSSSTYYQPSDNERPPSIEQLIEEGNRSQSPTSNLKILSDVVIEQAKIPVTRTDTILKKFNNNVIGKKNLSLLKRQTKELSLSESSSDSECEKKPDSTALIKDIINNVEVKSTLDKKSKNFRSELEEVRQRTIKQIKNSKKPVRKPPKRKPTKKKQTRDENISEEAKKLVEGLAERGINLIPNKTPQKPKVEEVDESSITFDEKVYETHEVMLHDEKNKKKVTKSYEFDICKKNFSVKVLMDDSNEEVTRILKWTECDGLMEIKSKNVSKSPEVELDDELMDYAIAGSGVEDTSDSRPSSKGGKKRKRVSENENKQIEKKNKLRHVINQLKNIDVDDFLDKVHGE